jgi:hypothetical protein
MGNLSAVFQNVISSISKLGFQAEYYSIPNYSGYSVVLNKNKDTVYCLEVKLGDSIVSGFTTYAVAQIFDSSFPTMLLVLAVDKSTDGQELGKHLPCYTRSMDKFYSAKFIPFMHTAFNELDPTGKKKGILIQSYYSKMTLGNLLAATIYTWKIITSFKRDGQLAQIAVDFDNRLIKTVATIMRPLTGVVGDMYHIPRTSVASQIRVPIRLANGDFGFVEDHSSALDEGIRLAQTYLRNHYQRYGLQKIGD